jgi:hypothetical protein
VGIVTVVHSGPKISMNQAGVSVGRPSWRRTAALLVVVLVGAFALLVAIMHVLEPEFDPSWRMLSEYALGRYGWLMNLAFRCLAIGSAILVITIWPDTGSRTGRSGVVMLAAFSAAVFAASFFPTAPITDTVRGIATRTGTIHSLCGVLAIFSFPFASTLVGIGVSRRDAWRPARQRLLWLLPPVWIGFLAFVWALTSGMGPQSWIGWPNRIMMALDCLWLATAAYEVARADETRSVPRRSAAF